MDITARAIERIKEKVDRAKYNLEQSKRNGWPHVEADKAKYEEYKHILEVLEFVERMKKL